MRKNTKSLSVAPFKPWSSEEAFRLLVESVPDYAIFTLDKFGKITSWNKGAERQFGYKEKEILGQHFSVLFTNDDIKKGAPQKEMEIASKQGKAPDKRFHVHKNGTKFFVDGTLTPMRDEMGKVCGFVKIIHKISENI